MKKIIMLIAIFCYTTLFAFTKVEIQRAKNQLDSLYKEYMQKISRKAEDAKETFKEYKEAEERYRKMLLTKTKKKVEDAKNKIKDTKDDIGEKAVSSKEFMQNYASNFSKTFFSKFNIDPATLSVESLKKSYTQMYPEEDIEAKDVVKKSNLPGKDLGVKPIFYWGDYNGQDKEFIRSADNYCGQYALSSVMNSLGKTIDFKKIYTDMNPAGIFSAPFDIVNYARKHGIEANKHNKGKAEHLVEQLDKGKPVVVLVDAGGTPHWVAVSGYTKDDNGNITWKLNDSYWGVDRNAQDYDNGVKSDGKGNAYVSNEDFMKIWGKPLAGMPGAVNALSSYKNLYVSFDNVREKKYSSKIPNSFDDIIASGATSFVRTKIGTKIVKAFKDDKIHEKFVDKVKSGWNSVKTTVSNGWNSTKKGVSNAWNKFKSWF